ncbi:hypothetical protein [Sphaerisporangium sp. NPDC051011]|uniref:hypothetical protein n=1 Tax=Sphaerisporangium sp. NPDC051011 TaxID=3155792 RepID=UPI0033DEA4CB
MTDQPTHEHGTGDDDPIECTAEAAQGQADEVARQQLRQRYAEALAAVFTWEGFNYAHKPYGDRPAPNLSDLAGASMGRFSVTGDGHVEMERVTCGKAAEVCAAVRDDELAALRSELRAMKIGRRDLHHAADSAAAYGEVQHRRAERAEIALARGRALAEELASFAPAGQRGLITPDVATGDAGRAFLAALDVPADGEQPPIPQLRKATPMPTMFRKKPVTVEAVQWTGANTEAVKAFVGQRDTGECRFLLPEEITGVWEDAHVYDELHNTWVTVYVGQWVVKGVKGEFYPIAWDVLAETYEPTPAPQADGEQTGGGS